MKNSSLFIFLFFLPLSNYGQDTIIKLNEVKIERTTLKKEIKKGFDSTPWLNLLNDYYNYYYFNKIEFPMGRPLELYINFQGTWDKATTKWSPVESRIFEIDFYSVNEEGTVGTLLNKTPFVINLPEHKNAYHIVKQQISLKEFDLYGTAFYLRISTPNQQKCDTCFQYWPVGYKSKDFTEMRLKKKLEQAESDIPAPTRLSDGIEIRYKVDILTNEY